jgi:hypothetical protein
MRHFAAFTVTAFLICMACARANAQDVPIVGNPNTITAGAFFPSGGAAQKYGGSSQLYVEARYGLPVDIPLSPTRTVVSVAAEFGNSNGGRSLIIPVTIGEYASLSGKSPFSPNTAYAGAGLGVYIENSDVFSTTTRIGGYGTIGYNLGLGFFVDAKYQVVEHGNGTLLGVGFRF